MKFLLLIALMFTAVPLGSTLTRAAQVIGPETLVVQPRESFFSSIINLRPGNGDVVTNNPPIFSWPYAMNPTNTATDARESTFRFQLSTNANFSSPIVDVNTPWNLYNFVPPITNADGSTFLGTNWWRVGYGTVTNGVTNLWITNWFKISATHSNWDRSMLANETLLAAKTHPYMLFNSANRGAVYQFAKTNDPAGWLYITNRARAAIDSAWWAASSWPTDGTVDVEARDNKFTYVAFCAALTQDAQWTNGLPKNFTNMVRWFVAANKTNVDYGAGFGQEAPLHAMVYGYDWCYPLLTSPERIDALAVLHNMARQITDSWVWRVTNNSGIAPSEPNPENYNGVWYVPWYQAGKMFTPHAAVTFNVKMLVGLCAFSEDAQCRRLFDLSANYILGRTYTYGTYAAANQGRSYAYNGFWSGPMHSLPAYAMSFPEAGFERAPFIQGFADWWSRMLPPGYKQVHEPWGDVDIYSAQVWSFAGDLAMLSRDGNAWNHYLTQQTIENNAGAYPTGLPNTILPYHYPPPTRTTNNLLGKLFAEDGWVFGSSHSPNTPTLFTNGVGFIFQARPRGSEMGHSHQSDLAFEMWAYGANITDGGGGMNHYVKTAQAHPTVLINGLGVYYPQDGPRRSNYCQIVNFTNNADFVYACGDSTYGFPHETFEGNGYLSYGYDQIGTVQPQTHVRRVRRHVLFPRRKYLVLYDEFQTATNCTFSWVYPVNKPLLSLDTSAATFSYSATNWRGGNVTTYVAHVTSPGGLSWTNMSGTNFTRNAYRNTTWYGATPDVTKANVVWVQNAARATNWHFMTVIYPVYAGTSLPTITRLSDNTVAVTNGSDGDVISFGETNALSTLILNMNAASGESANLSPVSRTTIGTIRAGGTR